MDLDHKEDNTLLWIAREGVDAALPAEWKPCQSPDGKIYYFNFETEESVWDHPSDEYYKRLFRTEQKKLTERKPAKTIGPGAEMASYGVGGTPTQLRRQENDEALTPQGTTPEIRGHDDRDTDAGSTPGSRHPDGWDSHLDHDETSEDGTDFEYDDQDEGDDIIGAGVRCLSALSVTATLEQPYGIIATTREHQVRSILCVC